MSHNHDTTIICPNCGYDAKYNYCARCGQATHLHKDTFTGLILHFVEHYFHYDSKFWKTLKTLWFKPGALTIAYREKQRMRYIPPVSLYIFISAVFFLAFLFWAPNEKTIKQSVAKSEDSATKAKGRARVRTILGPFDLTNTIDTSNHPKKLAEDRSPEENRELIGRIAEHFIHSIPKWFFFMIPIMGLVLLLLFARRKQLYFVDHTIFSLHIHSFIFSIFLLSILDPFDAVDIWVQPILFLVTIVYFIAAMRKTYAITWIRSVCYSFIIGFSYFLFLIIVAAGNFVYLMYQEGLLKDV